MHEKVPVTNRERFLRVEQSFCIVLKLFPGLYLSLLFIGFYFIVAYY